jgi:hypothetical protein
MTGMDPATVTVRGDAFIRTEPDEAVLWITLRALEPAPGAALSDVSARSRALFALLDEAGVAKSDRWTSGISVSEEFDHATEDRDSLGHRASSRVSARLSDPERIGQLVARTTEELAAQVNGPRWLISLDNPARLEAARQAAADARRKAQAYAEGVGAELGRLVRLSEPGERGEIRLHALAARGGHQSMPVEPGEQEVVASIEATFTLELG